MKSERVQEITNRLAAVRTGLSLSASVLASMAGVSRQTIYAIENGSFIPNTTVSLRLARALGVRVDEIFRLPESVEPDRSLQSVTLLPCSEAASEGQSVQLCRVDGRVVASVATPPSWFLPASDGVVAGCTPAQIKARVHLHRPNEKLDNRLLLAGCDPAMTLIEKHLRSAGVKLVIVHRNSSQSLSLLKRGLVHIAGIHLGNEITGETNVAAIKQHFASESVQTVSFAAWDEGLIVAHKNPKQIKGVADLVRRKIRFLNREPGAGSRFLLDRHLKRLKIDPKRIVGYDHIASGHLAAAWEVKAGNVDCCVATRAAARLFGLEFLHLESSPYDLVVRRVHFHLPAIQTLFEVINTLNFRHELNQISGYSTAATGSQV